MHRRMSACFSSQSNGLAVCLYPFKMFSTDPTAFIMLFYGALWHGSRPKCPLRDTFKVRAIYDGRNSTSERQSEEKSACCPARQRWPQRANRLSLNIFLLFGTIVPFKCLFYCSTCFCCFMSDDQTWDKTGSKSRSFPDWFFLLSAEFFF